MAKLFWLNVTQAAAIEPLLPQLGSRPRVDDHRLPDGILHRFRKSLHWRAHEASRTTVFNRFNRRSQRGLRQEPVRDTSVAAVEVDRQSGARLDQSMSLARKPFSNGPPRDTAVRLLRPSSRPWSR